MLRIGFVGTGNFANQHAETLLQLGMKIAGCYGTNSEKTQKFAKDFQCSIYNDPIKLISKDIIDALYIAIPPFAHDGTIELKAIENKIPFFCEKPVGLTLSLSKKISESIIRVNLLTCSGYLLRYDPIFTTAKKILDRNQISTIRICSYSYMPNVHWWRQKKLSGGMMVESGSHYIDLLRFLFGEITTIASVTAQGLAIENVPDCDIDDSMESIFKFKNGYIGSFGVTHLLNNINARNDMLEVYGQDFALKIDLYKLRYRNEASIVYKEPGDTDWKYVTSTTSKKELLQLESSHFLNAIQQNNASLIKSSYPDAVKSLEIALAMNQSAAFNQFSLF